jgi:hypothetical protein
MSFVSKEFTEQVDCIIHSCQALMFRFKSFLLLVVYLVLSCTD